MTGRIRDEDLEEVRRKSALQEVAADYMQVRKAGRLFKARCPFHSEKTPSFSIDPAKGLYMCFGCQKGGDVFTLVMELEQLSFAEAVEALARRSGITLRYEQMSPADRRAATRRERLIEAHRAAAGFYHEALMGSGGVEARDYLKGRGFKRESVERFQVGLSPYRRDDLARFLLKRGFSEAELVEAGLGTRTEGGRLVDRFRARIMFPIHDLTGNPVAFGARRLSDSGEGPKYLNSAESPVYKKGNVLYGLDRAKGEVVRAGSALVVEGYTDVIALHQAGVGEAVATCGTALGSEHFRLLTRFTQRMVLAFDSDDAGRAAAERAFEHAQAAKADARVLVLPSGSDPAEFVMEKGGETFRALAAGAVPLIEFRLRREVERFDVEQPENRARALQAALPILATVQDEVVRTEYARRLSEWVRVDANLLFVRLDQALRSGAVMRPPDLKRLGAHVRCEREAIKLALQYPVDATEYAAAVDPEDFGHPAYRRIWELMRGGADAASLRASDDLDSRARSEVTALTMDPPEGVESAAPLPPRLAEEIFGRVKEFSLSRQIEVLKERLQRLNPEKDPGAYDALFKDLVALEGRKRRLTMVLQDETGGSGGDAVAPGRGGTS